MVSKLKKYEARLKIAEGISPERDEWKKLAEKMRTELGEYKIYYELERAKNRNLIKEHKELGDKVNELASRLDRLEKEKSTNTANSANSNQSNNQNAQCIPPQGQHGFYPNGQTSGFPQQQYSQGYYPNGFTTPPQHQPHVQHTPPTQGQNSGTTQTQPQNQNQQQMKQLMSNDWSNFFDPDSRHKQRCELTIPVWDGDKSSYLPWKRLFGWYARYCGSVGWKESDVVSKLVLEGLKETTHIQNQWSATETVTLKMILDDLDVKGGSHKDNRAFNALIALFGLTQNIGEEFDVWKQRVMNQVEEARVSGEDISDTMHGSILLYGSLMSDEARYAILLNLEGKLGIQDVSEAIERANAAKY